MQETWGITENPPSVKRGKVTGAQLPPNFKLTCATKQELLTRDLGG